jgi:flagellar protein FliO/FliZ
MRHKVQSSAIKPERQRSSISVRGFFILCLIILALGIAVSGSAASEKKKSAAKEVAPRQVTDFTVKKPEESQSPTAVIPPDQVTPDAAKKTEGDLYSYDKPEVEESSYGWLFFKTVIILGLFGLGFYFFFKYVTKKSGFMSTGSGAANILSILPIGQNKFIHIVDIGGRLLVLGVTENSINLITELKEKDEIERVRLQSSKTTPIQQHSFQDFVMENVGSLVEFVGRTKKSLEKKKEKKREPIVDEYINEDNVDYIRNQRERLRRLNGHNGDSNDR